jgi:hypothetical protein
VVVVGRRKGRGLFSSFRITVGKEEGKRHEREEEGEAPAGKNRGGKGNWKAERHKAWFNLVCMD